VISADPREERWFRRATAAMLISMTLLLALRACQAVHPSSNWRGPCAVFEAEARHYWSHR
jgi:hypothetical protein